MIRMHHAVFRVHGRAFDNRQQIALHAFARHVRPGFGFASGDFVNFIQKNNPGLFDALQRLRDHFVHVQQLLRLFLFENAPRFRDFQLALLRLRWKQAGRQHVADVDVFLHPGTGENFNHGAAVVRDFDFHDAIFDAPVAQKFTEFLPRSGAGIVFRAILFLAARRRQQQIEQPLFGQILRFFRDRRFLLFFDHAHAQFHQVADHGFDIAPHVADFGKFGRFDFEKWRLH